MRRRELLGRVGAAVGAVAGLSGCTTHSLQESEREPAVADGLGEEEVDLPVSQPLGVAEDGIERGTEADVADVDDLEAYLDDAGIDVEHLAEEENEAGAPIVSLEYVVEETLDQGAMHHVGLVAGGYAALVDAGHEGEKLEASLLDSASREFGEYEIRRHWAEEYNGGALTAREFADEIGVTLATT